MMRTKTLKKLALTQPKVAAAARAARAEMFLDQRKEKKASNTKKARPGSAPAPHSNTRRQAPTKQRKQPQVPVNPAEVGIPEGGNWKSVGAYTYNEDAASQLPAPWATHYHVFEKFPEPEVSARSKKTQELQNKMTLIQAQLREVEEELEVRRKEREEVGKKYNQSRKVNGLPLRRNKVGNNYGKVKVKKGTRKVREGGGGKTKKKQMGSSVTVSASARDYLAMM